jgi:NADPH:quinone reductase-like Zn-dependent oxidoreductase
MQSYILKQRISNITHQFSRNMSSTIKAVVIRGKEAKLERDRALPKLRDDYILVKTEAVALNPTDWKHVAFGLGAEGGLVGCDFAGTVVEVGNAVTKGWKKGDRLAGVNHGGNSSNVEDGAFAEYVVSKGAWIQSIPSTSVDIFQATCRSRSRIV